MRSAELPGSTKSTKEHYHRKGAVLPTQQNSTNIDKRKVTCNQPKMLQLQKVSTIKHYP